MLRKLPQARTAVLCAATLAALSASTATAADYSSTVQADNPQAYYRLNDSLVRANVNNNLGSASNADATNLNVRSFPGAIVGSSDRATFFTGHSRSMIPFNPDLNPSETQPFTMEVWLYPTSDQTSPGMAPINNRYAYSGVDRQGWVIFQRSPDATYPGEPPGWDFRMFRGSGSSTGLDVRSPEPYRLGEWTHMVVVYEPNNVEDATVTIYINGVETVTQTWPGGNPAYKANTGGHPAGEAPFGDAGLAFGGYNNTGDTAGGPDWANGYVGALDEFAFYTNKVTPEKILAHYQNATNSARAVSYSSLVLGDKPVAYLSFNELPPAVDTSINTGDLRDNAEPVSTAKVQRNRPGAIVSEPNDQSFGYHLRNGGGSRTVMPFNPRNNPDEGVPFTVEFWVNPETDQLSPGAAVVNNRKPISNRTGWVIFQRKPNASYPTAEVVGYNFRMYNGAGTGGQDVNTLVEYKIGEWQHLVFTWQPDPLDGEPGVNRSGTLAAYVNGELASENSTATYKANTEVPEDSSAPADLAIGSYNGASNFGQEFTGSVDEFAIYTNIVLTADQIKSHYDAGTNAHPATNYETLVLSAPYNYALDNGLTHTPRMGPVTYLRFNDPAPRPATNSGTLGSAADASLINATNNLSGPRPSAFAGFANTNWAASFDGTQGWMSLNHPAGLDFTGNITLEAWIKPSETQGAKAGIISHGPALLTVYPDLTDNNFSLLSSPDVSLGIDGTAGNYVLHASDGTNEVTVTAAIPAGDLGSTTWIHLAATYDGTNWNIYRNGAAIATEASTIGAMPVPNGNWAVGSTGAGWGDFFAGGIDEVAIFNTALSAARIQAHYAASTTSGTAATISVSLVAGKPTITFVGGVLQEASAVTGTYSTISGAQSPYQPTVPAGASMKFYRVLAQ